jgi:hypothetical protein
MFNCLLLSSVLDIFILKIARYYLQKKYLRVLEIIAT